jgi:cell wall-associated NlpC family hydrolase
MKKHFVTTTLTMALTFTGLGVTSIIPLANPLEVSAATTTISNNQQAVEAKADQLIQDAKDLIGQATYSTAEYKRTYPYKFSCATFLNFIFEKNGVDLATYNENYMIEQGYYVPKNQLQKGDLVFFDSNRTNSDPTNHVGMYIGDNKIIHMADSKQNIVISDLDDKAYYRDNYVTARRVLPSLLSANPATQGDKIVDLSYSLKDKVTMGSTNDTQAMKFTRAGFINYVYNNVGIDLGTTNIKAQMDLGKNVARENLKKGDLIFFNSSIGSSTPTSIAIYAGDHRIIVPTSSGVLTRVLFVDYYQKHYITAKRVL